MSRVCQKVYLIGAGGHAKVVAEIVQQRHELAGFLDDDATRHGDLLMGRPIVGPVAYWSSLESDGWLTAIGDNQTRRRICQLIAPTHADIWLTAVHEAAIVSPSARIGRGTVLAAGVIVNAEARIGAHSIINTGAVVDHDTVVGDYAHIAPRAVLAGGVTIGEGAFVGLGATVLPGCTIGAWAVVGASACVTRSVADGATVVGVPAKPLKPLSSQTESDVS